jgi:predicted ATPase/DNA-binding SARP family transcriptional activator
MNWSARMAVGSDWQLHLLGDFRLLHNGQPVSLARQKMKLLLAYLALHSQEHSREKVSGLFWGDSTDDEARHSLRTTLSMLRDALGGEAILANRDTLRMNPAFPLWLDAFAFERQASRFLAEPGDDVSSAGADLYQGDLLADFYDDWILPERERLRSLCITVLLQLVQQMRSQSTYDRAIQFAQRILTIEPAHERAHQHMMFCFMAMGDRSAALRQYEECKRSLQEELTAEPMAETTALYEWIRGRPAYQSPREAMITNLPIPLTSFVGRAREVAEVRGLLQKTRLVTITGPGGSGKTRLAIQTATSLLDSYKDGVWFIDLASIQDPALAPQVVARTLGVETGNGRTATAALADFLCARQTLLVLDNCEHVVAACAELAAALLGACARAAILATSRVTLGVMGELAWPIPTLSLPAEMSTPSLASLSHFESTRLFLERAALAAPTAALSDRDAAAVVLLCRQLEGMPLAIELAAARLKVMSAGQIAGQLHDRFSLLVSGRSIGPRRQQSLRAAIDWSYDLLAGEEQALFRCLSVFVGGCSLAGAAAAYDDKSETRTLDVLSRLSDKSLIVVDHSGAAPRYRLLETIRLYAWDRLLESGEKDAVTQRAVLFLSSLAEQVEDAYLRGKPQPSIQEIGIEFDNLRMAVAWCEQGGHAALGLRLVAALPLVSQTDLAELGDWITTMLALGQDAPPLTRGRALLAAGSHARLMLDSAQALALSQEGLALCRALGNREGIAYGLWGVGRSAMWLQREDIAEPALAESLAISRELGYHGASVGALDGLARLHWQRGDQQGAVALAEEALALARQINQGIGIQLALSVIGGIALQEGDDERATACAQEALAVCFESGWTREVAYNIAALAGLAAAHGQAERCALLWGAANALADAIHRPAPDWAEDYFAPHKREAVAQLGPTRFDELAARGRSLSLAQAVAYALEKNPGHSPPTAPVSAAGSRPSSA